MLIAATSPLLLLAVLACPIGMGAMMLFMGRGMMGGTKQKDERESGADASSLAAMKAEQARLADKIATLEEQSRPRSAEAAIDRDPNPVS